MARACIREELASKFRDDIRDLMDLWETQMGVAPLDNAVNTKGTRPGANPCVHATRRLCASNTFFSGERGYARSHPSPQTRTTNTQRGGGGARWVAVASAVAVGGGATQTRVQTSGFCMRVGNSPDLRASEKGGGRGRIDERETERAEEGVRKGETERGKEKREGVRVRQRRKLREREAVYVYMADT